jgi:hypothetical protein
MAINFIPPKSGWKTYAVVLIGVGLGIAQHFGWQIPSYVDWVLTFLGMGALRHAVQTKSAKSTDDVADLVNLVLQNITQPAPPDPNAGTTGATVKDVPVEVHVLQPVAQ